MSAKVAGIIDTITLNAGYIQSNILLLMGNSGCSEEQQQVLGRATESLAIWEVEQLSEIRKVFEKEQ